MARKCAVSVVLILIASVCMWSDEAKTTAAERLKQALAVTNELASNAQCADEKTLKEVAPTPAPQFPEMSGLPQDNRWARFTKDDRVFPTIAQVLRYQAARPWQSDYWLAWQPTELRNPTEPQSSWPTLGDAPVLRRLLGDKDPAIRSLAVEALSSLSQPEDVSRIGQMLSDTADGALSLEWNSQLSALCFPQAEDKDSVDVFRSWRGLSVSTYAQRAIWYMTRRKLDVKTFPKWWERNKDAKSSLWYWQQRMQNGMTRVKQAYDAELPPCSNDRYTSKGEAAARKMKARQKAVPDEIGTKLRKMSPEVEAKVKLLAVPVSDPYTRFEEPNIYTPLDLRLKSSRLLDLLDRKGLWNDVDWEASLELDRSNGYFYRMVERMARASDELFTRNDVARLRAVLEREKGKMPRQCQVELIMGISRLLPPALPSRPDDLNTREGFVESQVTVEEDEYTRGMIAARLVEIGLPGSWPFLKTEFFRNATLENSSSKRGIVVALGAPPLTPAKRDALADLILDSRYTPLMKLSGSVAGGDAYRESARFAVNAHAGKQIITDAEEHAIPTSDEVLNAVVQKVRELARAD